jgi:hypothetical protein
MDEGERFARLVAEATARWQADPAAHRAHGRRLVAIAYAPLVLVGAVIALAVAALIAAMVVVASPPEDKFPFLVFALGFVYVLWRWVRFVSPPLAGAHGRPLSPEDAPELFRLVGEIGVARVDRVCVDDSLNGSLVQEPRWGLLGGYTNTLVLGVGLLHALDRDGVRALVAHELAHLAGGHGRTGAWVARVTTMAAVVRDGVEVGRFQPAWLYRRFLSWWEPQMHAWAAVQGRVAEIEADRRTDQVVGPAVAIGALTRAELLDGLSDAVHDRVTAAMLVGDDAPSPLDALFEVVRATEADRDAVAARLARRVAAVSTPLDPHPSLAERARAAGVAPTVPPPVTLRADAALLGPVLPTLMAENAAWWAEVRPQEAQARRDQRARRDALAAEADRTPASTVQLALDVADVGDRPRDERRAAAIELLEAEVARTPTHAPAWFHLGRLLLEADAERGLDALARAVSLDARAEDEALELRVAWWKRVGDAARAEADERRLITLHAALSRAREERHRARSLLEFEDAGLTAEQRAVVVALLGPDVAAAWVARVVVRHVPERPMLAVHVAWVGWGPVNEAKRAALLERLVIDTFDVYLDDGWTAAPWRRWRLRRPEHRVR